MSNEKYLNCFNYFVLSFNNWTKKKGNEHNIWNEISTEKLDGLKFNCKSEICEFTKNEPT